jgi:hypothetical protein
MKGVLILGFCAACACWAAAADEPPADAFRVFPPAAKEAPVITPYLQYQTEMAGQQDDERRKEWSAIGTEQRAGWAKPEWRTGRHRPTIRRWRNWISIART